MLLNEEQRIIMDNMWLFANKFHENKNYAMAILSYLGEYFTEKNKEANKAQMTPILGKATKYYAIIESPDRGIYGNMDSIIQLQNKYQGMLRPVEFSSISEAQEYFKLLQISEYVIEETVEYTDVMKIMELIDEQESQIEQLKVKYDKMEDLLLKLQIEQEFSKLSVMEAEPEASTSC